jgi:hypothetical protein
MDHGKEPVAPSIVLIVGGGVPDVKSAPNRASFRLSVPYRENIRAGRRALVMSLTE